MRRLTKWLSNVFLGLLILLTVILIVLPAIFASRLAVVYSGSMAPAMPTGSLALMQPVDPAEIQVGDVIAFNPPWDKPEVTVSHRVIEVIKEPALGFLTKGDANEDPDLDMIPAANVKGRVAFSVRKVGYALNYIGRYTRGRIGFGFFVALPAILLIGSAIRDVSFVTSPRVRRAKRRQEMIERRRRRFHR